MHFIRPFVKSNNFKTVVVLALLFCIINLSACCVRNKTDPLEKVNRKIFIVNRTVDALYLKPAALFYDKFLPKPFRYATNSFFQNLREIPTIVNDLLQLKFKQARTAMARVCINTTWGVLGFIDVATFLGKIEKHTNDFGLTMAHYGYKDSIYLMIPLIGPSTFRDAVGIYVDTYTGVWPYIKPRALGWTLYAISLVDARARMLHAEPIIEEASVDEYIFIRNAYLQHRRYLMNMDKEPVVGDLSAADLPDDNEASSSSGSSSSSGTKPDAADMPDDNEPLKPGDKDAKDKDKDKDGKDKNSSDKDGKDAKQEEKPKVGAAAVAALEVDDIYNPSKKALDPEEISVTTLDFRAKLIVTPETIFTIAPGVYVYITVIVPSFKELDDANAIKDSNAKNSNSITDSKESKDSSARKQPANPEEIKGTSTITDAVGGRSK